MRAEVEDAGSYERLYLGVALNPENGTEFVPFTPSLSDSDAARLRQLGSQLALIHHSADRVAAVRQALHDVDGRAYKLRAVLSILLDLVRHEYCVRVDQGTLLVSATTLATWKGNPIDYKVFQRRHLLQERDEQLRRPSVKQFIDKMESARLHNGKQVSILSLVPDGASVLRAIEEFRARHPPMGTPATVIEAVRALPLTELPIRPYVQEVTSGARDSHTGLPLQSIWRYFRHTWALPYNSTPGRNMQFLVRDAAQPNHSVIGILGLGSSIIQITSRDSKLGWTVDAAIERFASTLGLPEPAGHQAPSDGQISEFIELLEVSLRRARSEINHSGLVRRTAPPSDDVIAIVEGLLEKYAKRHAKVRPLRRAVSYRAESSTPLYLKKRAKALVRILRAQQLLDETAALPPRERLARLLTTPAARAAVACALQEQKKRHVGSSIMDLVVCGAVEPYSHLLSGKLVAMLATSPTVTRAYQRKYAEAPSEIASAMKGGPVTRPAELVFLGTTSLYETHSSQYERISLPSELGGLRYKCLGKTEGFSSVHFSRETRDLLGRLSKRVRGRVTVTHKFGEGVNPKLRVIGMGLTDLGLDGRLLKYSSRRLVYGVELASNMQRYLLGYDARPKYWWADRDDEAEQRIASYWFGRWALPRAARAETITALKSADATHVSSAVRPRRSETRLESFG